MHLEDALVECEIGHVEVNDDEVRDELLCQVTHRA
jgi:hypothetical protein